MRMAQEAQFKEILKRIEANDESLTRLEFDDFGIDAKALSLLAKVIEKSKILSLSIIKGPTAKAGQKCTKKTNMLNFTRLLYFMIF